MRIISLANQKGGVGKTTCAINIGGALASLGKRVLLVDLDPQANLTLSLGIKLKDDQVDMYTLLVGKSTVNEVIIKRSKNLDVIPSSVELADAEVELSGLPAREMILKKAIAPIISNYDYIIIDCPPSLTLLTFNAFAASSEVFIPLQTEYLALQGTGRLTSIINIIKTDLNPPLRITGVIATMFDKRKVLGRGVIEVIKKGFNNTLFNTFIRENIVLAEAPSKGQTILEYKPDSFGAEDFISLTKEIIKQEGGTNGQ